MAGELEIHFLHSDVRPVDLQNKVAVPIDILRANTTIVTALQNKADRVSTFQTVAETRAFRQNQNVAENPVLCGGERRCRRIDGFEFGNSPGEYVADRVAGRHIAISHILGG